MKKLSLRTSGGALVLITLFGAASASAERSAIGVIPKTQNYRDTANPTANPQPTSVQWNQYFGPQSPYPAHEPWHGGFHNDGPDSFQTFVVGVKTFLHISLVLEASDDALAWADSVVAAHPGLPTIVTTHEYVGGQDDANDKAIYSNIGYLGANGNNVQAVWDKFISQHDQIFQVIRGHDWSSTVNGASEGENSRMDNNAFGHPVYQVLSDFPGNPSAASGTPSVLTGGPGWLRLLTFDTEAGTIHFQTCSTELKEYAGVPGGPTFNWAPSPPDFTLPSPLRVRNQRARWRFGLMSDNQWTGTADDGFNPNTVPVDIIKQIDAEFIAWGVKFVLDVGDTVDVGSNPNLDTTAVFRQDLYNAGIGFFPVRGNHEAGTPGSGTEWSRVFPQMFNGMNNETPADAFTVFNPDAATQPFPAKAGQPFNVGANFSQPAAINRANNAVSYSFDYHNARFVLLDQSGNAGEENNISSIPALQPWITQQLADPARPEHAFVISHKNLLGGAHKDNLFGNHSGSDPGDADWSQWPAQNAFIRSLAFNNVHYYISGHDHHHYDSVVTCPDGSAKVHQIISASDSSKFYTPHTPVSTNDTPVSQDLYNIGYYIYTVDGPRVTVDYYGVPSGQVGGFLPSAAPGTHATPTLTANWRKLLTWGYSLNGQEFIVPEGSPYTVVADSTDKAVANGESGYLGTAMQILAGMNTSTATNNYGKAQAKAVNTGWTPAQERLASDILTLWGMADVGTEETIPYVLLMSFDKSAPRDHFGTGDFGIATRDADGEWVNAVRMNFGGGFRFEKGPWRPYYPLGTYGLDADAGTAWAVINYNGDFAVTTDIEPRPRHRHDECPPGHGHSERPPGHSEWRSG